MSNGEKLIPFTISEPQYNQSSYWGRVATFAAATNPKYAFLSKSYINEKIKLIQDQKNVEKQHFEKHGTNKVLLTQA